jgi:hypothetical protein
MSAVQNGETRRSDRRLGCDIACAPTPPGPPFARGGKEKAPFARGGKVFGVASACPWRFGRITGVVLMANRTDSSSEN